MLLVGQSKNLELINKWSELPQFLIIQGDEHTGKNYMVLYLCKKFGLRYNLIGNSVNNVRSLVNTMTSGSKDVYHFDNFNTATLQAKNALLKVTEEPLPGNHIIITGGPQIKTLESRAKRIIMSPYTFEEVNKYIGDKIQDEQYKINLYNAGINTPAKFSYYQNYENLQNIMNTAYEIFSKITYLSTYTYIPLLNQFDDRYDKDKKDDCMLFLDMLINLIETRLKTNYLYSYTTALEILIDARQQLRKEPTLKRKMLLFRTFYTIQQYNNGGIN